MPISNPYVTICQQLQRAGGVADIDHFGNISAGAETLSGSTADWLWLIAHGLIARNRNNQLVLTALAQSVVRASQAHSAEVIKLSDVRAAREVAAQ